MLGKIHTGRYEDYKRKSDHQLSRAIKDIALLFEARLKLRAIEIVEARATAVANLVAECRVRLHASFLQGFLDGSGKKNKSRRLLS